MATFFLGRWHANKADGTLPQSSLSPPHTHLSLLPLPSISQLPSSASPPLSPCRKPEMLCTARRMGHTPSPLGCREQRGQGGKWLCPNRWRQLAAKSCFYRYVCTHPHAYICTHTHIYGINVYIHISVRFTPSSTPQSHFAISFRPSVPYPRYFFTLSWVALRCVWLRYVCWPCCITFTNISLAYPQCPPQFPCPHPTPSICQMPRHFQRVRAYFYTRYPTGKKGITTLCQPKMYVTGRRRRARPNKEYIYTSSESTAESVCP